MHPALPTQQEAGELLDRLVALFNACVRVRDFSKLLDLFDEDAILEIEGVPERGPFDGKAAIARHFSDEPPDDEIRVTRWKLQGAAILAQFVWSDIPEACGGAIAIALRDQKIARLTLAFGGPAARWT